MSERKARIMSIERVTFTSCVVTTGIKKWQQPYYNNHPGYKGHNGAYAHDFESETPQILVKLCIYETPTEPKDYVTIDIRDRILAATGQTRVSAQRLQYIIDNNKGRKVRVMYDKESGKLSFIDDLILV